MSLPAISTGLFRFPLEKAATTILEAINEYASVDSRLCEVNILDQISSVVSQFAASAASVFKDRADIKFTGETRVAKSEGFPFNMPFSFGSSQKQKPSM